MISIADAEVVHAMILDLPVQVFDPADDRRGLLPRRENLHSVWQEKIHALSWQMTALLRCFQVRHLQSSRLLSVSLRARGRSILYFSCARIFRLDCRR
jgi:hypothetical protein